MTPETRSNSAEESIVDPSYSSGDYFADAQRHSGDARFKAENFLKLFRRFRDGNTLSVESIVDVGCGSGDVVKMIAKALREQGGESLRVKAYDVSPHVSGIHGEGVEFIQGDFCASNEAVDVVTLFDVFEHVPDPVGFIKSVAQRCKLIGFHIPLDNSLNVGIRNMYHDKLHYPGHLVFLDTASALNLLAIAGLRVVDYEYTFGFQAPSGHNTILSKILFPVRYFVARISPWLMSKTLGGTSLMVLAMTPQGLKQESTGQ